MANQLPINGGQDSIIVDPIGTGGGAGGVSVSKFNVICRSIPGGGNNKVLVTKNSNYSNGSSSLSSVLKGTKIYIYFEIEDGYRCTSLMCNNKQLSIQEQEITVNSDVNVVASFEKNGQLNIEIESYNVTSSDSKIYFSKNKELLESETATTGSNEINVNSVDTVYVYCIPEDGYAYSKLNISPISTNRENVSNPKNQYEICKLSSIKNNITITANYVPLITEWNNNKIIFQDSGSSIYAIQNIKVDEKKTATITLYTNVDEDYGSLSLCSSNKYGNIGTIIKSIKGIKAIGKSEEYNWTSNQLSFGDYFIVFSSDYYPHDYEVYGRYEIKLNDVIEQEVVDKTTVTFNGNGGDFTSFEWDLTNNTTTYVYGKSTYTKLGSISKKGYILDGWYDDKQIKVYNGDGSFVPTSSKYFSISGKWVCTIKNITLYAKWNPIEYHLSYNGNGAMSGSTSPSKNWYKYGEDVTISKNGFVRPNYIFSHWTDANGIGYEQDDVVNNLTTVNGATFILYASWNKADISVEYEEDPIMKNYNSASAYGIKKIIETGGANYSSTDELEYRIRVVDPDSIEVLDAFSPIPVMMETEKNVIHSVAISRKNDTNNLNIRILNRYSGYYNPIFKDILFYGDYDSDHKFSNTKFDYTYSDNYGKFGVIENMWFHKIDDEDKNILGTKSPVYPLTGEYALDCRDYNIFSSNWDIDYYTKQIDIKKCESVEKIGSMKDGLCMFGSKYLNTPDRIEIECFNKSTSDKKWDDGWISNPDGCDGEVMFREINNNSVDFYFFIRKRLIRFFYEKMKDEFSKYISNDYSYGADGIEDDIKEYISKNVLKLYELKKIRVFVKRKKMGVHNSKINNDYEKCLKYNLGNFRYNKFEEITNVSLTKKSIDDFDRQLTYNLRNGEQEEFGFTIIIKKI